MVRRAKAKAGRCAWHRPDNFAYVHASIDAEERLERGERQRQCPLCFLWHWPHEWGGEPAGLNLPVILPEEESV
jgi:hypothetical protein